MKDIMRDELGAPKIVDRSSFQAELDALRVREKAHTREGDAIAAARRLLPMVEVDGAIQLIGERGAVALLDAFEGRRMLIAPISAWRSSESLPRRSRGDPRPGPTGSWRPWPRRDRHLSSGKGQDCRALGRSAARAREGCQRKHDVLIAVITAPPACRRETKAYPSFG